MFTSSWRPKPAWLRPRPDFFTPPHVAVGSPKENRWSLIVTVPACSSSANLRAVRRERVHPEAVRPNEESFASRIASSRDATHTNGRSGPEDAAPPRPPGAGGADGGFFREPDRLVERVNRHDGQERPECLVAHRAHRVVHAREDGRREPPSLRARALATHEDLRAPLNGILKMLLDEVPLTGGR